MDRNVDWASWKALVAAKTVRVQFTENPRYVEAFFVDGGVHYRVILPNDSEERTEWEVTYRAISNAPVDQRTADWRLRIATEKGTAPKRNIYSHNFGDTTTWAQGSTYVADEAATPISPDNGLATRFALAFPNVVDTYHGKTFQERLLLDSDGRSYRVAVRVNGVAQVERDPHYAAPQPGETFTVDYAAGEITFLTPIADNADVRVDYHYAGSSLFKVKPTPGKLMILGRAEAQFSIPINPKDTCIFAVKGYAAVFAPAQVLAGQLAPTDLVTIEDFHYQTMADFQSDAMGSYPTYPAMGDPGNWRALAYPVTVFDWMYMEGTPISSRAGMELWLYLLHDQPYEGQLASVSLYNTESDDA